MTATRTRRPPTAVALRPQPPAELATVTFDDADERFVPAPDVVLWARRTFIESVHGSRLHNADHGHLAMADLGVLWTNAKHVRQGRAVMGTAEMFAPKGGRWQVARQRQQVVEWFGRVPDFLITLSAPYANAADDAAFCALLEHELYHCAQATDDFGAPRFSRETGTPIWTIRAHDVEQFTGVVRRYGKDAAGVRAMVEAAAQHEREPVFPAAALAGACGTCLAGAR